MVMHSTTPNWLFILGPITLLMVLAVLAVFVALIWHERTRPFGLALLGVFGVVGLLLFGMVFSYSTVEYVPAQETLIQRFDGSNSSYPLPAIELEQAVKDMNATAPIAEVIEKLNDAADDSESVADSKEKEKEPDAMPRAASEEPSTLPDWVTALPSSVGGVWRQVISSGPRVDISDCSLAIDSVAQTAVQQYLSQIAQEEGLSQRVYLPQMLGISTNWIHDNLFCSTPEPYMQTTNSSVGPMQTLYVQLEFDPNDKEFIRHRLIDYVRRDRIAAVVTGGVFALSGIGLLFGLLKVDTWTKGYYTKRLFLGVPAAIIGVFILSSLFGF